MNNFEAKVNFIWTIAELLRGPYRPNQYKDVMLPLTVLRRLDCVLEPTKDKVLKKAASLKGGKLKNVEPILNKVAGQGFHNKSKFTFEKLKGDPNNIAANLTNYIKGFSGRAREIIDHFKFEEQIAKLDKADRLYLTIAKFCEIDLHPQAVSNIEMGYIFEELIRKFNEASNEEAGDHFTPREVIKLMVNLIFLPDNDILTTKGILKTLFDPACGTGGMLSVSDEYVRELNPNAKLEVFGQDYNDQSYAICGSDMMIKGQNIEHIQLGDSFTQDHFSQNKFDYMLANPPFGVEWKPQANFVKKEYEEQGFIGRFGAGLPGITDGSLLFLQHMISKMKEPREGGSRIGIVFNSSPLFKGAAGSGESDIRKWIIENDWLEAVISLPDQLFYNTGIYTFIWIVTNRKERKRQGKVQLIDAKSFFTRKLKGLGNKRNDISDDQIEQITKLYGEFTDGEFVKIYNNNDFCHYRLTVDRPLRLVFQVTKEKVDKLSEVSQFKRLATSKKRKNTKAGQEEIQAGQELQAKIIKQITNIPEKKTFTNRDTFRLTVEEELQKADIKLKASLLNPLVIHFSEKSSSGEICLKKDGKPEPDPDLRDFEQVPFSKPIEEYFNEEVLIETPDAWIDSSKTKTGYYMNFSNYFYKFAPPRELRSIESDLKNVEDDVAKILSEVTK